MYIQKKPLDKNDGFTSSLAWISWQLKTKWNVNEKLKGLSSSSGIIIMAEFCELKFY